MSRKQRLFTETLQPEFGPQRSQNGDAHWVSVICHCAWPLHATANIRMRFLHIPRDVMDKRAVEQVDVRFFDLAVLAVEVKTHKREVRVK